LSYVSKIGSSGSGDNQFNNPRGITTDGTYLYVADSSNHRIVKRLCTDLSYVSKIGSSGSGDDQFNNPRGITTDGTYLYVADSYNHRIVKRNDDLSYYTPPVVDWTYTIPDIYSVRQVLKGIEYEALEKLREDYITVYTLSASFTGTPLSGSTPITVQFTDASTVEVGILSSWNWSFGDSTPNSTQQNPAHTFTTSGCYDITLSITNSLGMNDTLVREDYVCAGNVTPTPTVTPTSTPTPTVTPTGTPPVQEEIPEGHLTPLAFVVLAFMVCGLTVYTFADNQNRNYLYIATAAVAMIMAFLLGIFLRVGTVSVDFVNTLDEVTINESVLSTYDVQRVAITDLGFGWFFIFWGVVMLIITILAVIELFREPQRRYEE
jgi:PKD repeat protein